MMKAHAFTVVDYYGKNMIGRPCHTYELRDNGKVLYRMHSELLEDGSELPGPQKVFEKKCDAIMEHIRKEDEGVFN